MAYIHSLVSVKILLKSTEITRLVHFQLLNYKQYYWLLTVNIHLHLSLTHRNSHSHNRLHTIHLPQWLISNTFSIMHLLAMDTFCYLISLQFQEGSSLLAHMKSLANRISSGPKQYFLFDITKQKIWFYKKINITSTVRFLN